MHLAPLGRDKFHHSPVPRSEPTIRHIFKCSINLDEQNEPVVCTKRFLKWSHKLLKLVKGD